MELNKFLQSKLFKRIIIALAAAIIALLSFGVGVLVGYNKARFSYAWGENYDRNFGGPPHGIFGFLPGGDKFMNAHGTFGSILEVNLGSSTLSVKGQDNIEKTVFVSSTTTITENRGLIKLSDIKINDPIVVIGSPNNQGQIEARLIRVLSEPPQPTPEQMRGYFPPPQSPH